MKSFALIRCASVVVFAVAGVVELRADETASEKVTPPIDKEFLPLDLLPVGTVLDEVRFPRYREGALLGEVLADRVTIVSESLVAGDSVDIFWQTGEKAGELTKARLPQARYDFRTGLMRATGGILIDDSRFTATGSELDLNMSLRRGWLAAPVQMRFFRQREAAVPENPNSDPMKNVLMRPLVAGLSVAYCLGAPPAAPTEAEWAAFDQAIALKDDSSLAPDQDEWKRFNGDVGIDPRAKESREAARETLRQVDEESAKAYERMNEFLTAVDRKLIQADKPEGAGEPGQNGGALGEPLQVPKLDEDTQAIEVRCVGGMFFDAEEGVFVYNDRTQVRDPQFSLDCSKQLKIYLAKKEPKDEESAKAEKPGQFGDLSRIAATGDVVLVTTNKKGETLTASAGEMTYEAQTGVILLRGGKVTLQQGKNVTVVTGADSFVKISEKEGAVIEGGVQQRFIKPN